MTLYELVFILLVLATVASIATLLVLAALRRWVSARKLALAVAAVWCIYLVVLAFSDLAARPAVTKAGQERCFDEMCFAVVSVQTSYPGSPGPSSVRRYTVTVRATSHSRGRTQAEGGLRARLYSKGKYFEVSQSAQESYEAEHGASPKLTQRLAPGQSIESVLVFDLPQPVNNPALTLDHGFTPGYFVIGESPFFHAPDTLQLPQEQ